MYGFCHIEIPTTDPSKSSKFYSSIFGWKVNESNPDYFEFSTPDDDGTLRSRILKRNSRKLKRLEERQLRVRQVSLQNMDFMVCLLILAKI
jgi:catechol 2,3-dioxygenase-like lactoylglutathione lyase family enzyme